MRKSQTISGGVYLGLTFVYCDIKRVRVTFNKFANVHGVPYVLCWESATLFARYQVTFKDNLHSISGRAFKCLFRIFWMRISEYYRPFEGTDIYIKKEWKRTHVDIHNSFVPILVHLTRLRQKGNNWVSTREKTHTIFFGCIPLQIVSSFRILALGFESSCRVWVLEGWEQCQHMIWTNQKNHHPILWWIPRLR